MKVMHGSNDATGQAQDLRGVVQAWPGARRLEPVALYCAGSIRKIVPSIAVPPLACSVTT